MFSLSDDFSKSHLILLMYFPILTFVDKQLDTLRQLAACTSL